MMEQRAQCCRGCKQVVFVRGCSRWYTDNMVIAWKMSRGNDTVHYETTSLCYYTTLENVFSVKMHSFPKLYVLCSFIIVLVITFMFC